jgi:hypothetical protein
VDASGDAACRVHLLLQPTELSIVSCLTLWAYAGQKQCLRMYAKVPDLVTERQSSFSKMLAALSQNSHPGSLPIPDVRAVGTMVGVRWSPPV